MGSSSYYDLPEPGDSRINVSDIKDAIDDYESCEPDESGEVVLPFSAELYVQLTDVWSEVNGCDEMILEDDFEDYITDIIDECYEIPKQVGWPYRHLRMDYVSAAEEAKQDYTSVSFGGCDYLCR